MHQLVLISGSPFKKQDNTVYSGPRPLFGDPRKFLVGSVFINIFKSLIMRNLQPVNKEPYPSV